MAWILWGCCLCVLIAVLIVVWVVAQAYSDSEDADVVDEGDGE
jgi:hypothetical protein